MGKEQSAASTRRDAIAARSKKMEGYLHRSEELHMGICELEGGVRPSGFFSFFLNFFFLASIAARFLVTFL